MVRVMELRGFAAGLRVSELVRLGVADLDSSRMMIRVRQGKGQKDRYTILSRRLLRALHRVANLPPPGRRLIQRPPGGLHRPDT